MSSATYIAWSIADVAMALELVGEKLKNASWNSYDSRLPARTGRDAGVGQTLSHVLPRSH